MTIATIVWAFGDTDCQAIEGEAAVLIEGL
jgi:hypothetical protein